MPSIICTRILVVEPARPVYSTRSTLLNIVLLDPKFKSTVLLVVLEMYTATVRYYGHYSTVRVHYEHRLKASSSPNWVSDFTNNWSEVKWSGVELSIALEDMALGCSLTGTKRTSTWTAHAVPVHYCVTVVYTRAVQAFLWKSLLEWLSGGSKSHNAPSLKATMHLVKNIIKKLN